MVIIVLRTFISVRDNLGAPVVAPGPCCWTCPAFWSHDVVAIATFWLRPAWTLFWRLMVRNMLP